MYDKNLIWVNLPAESAEDAILAIGGAMVDAGLVYDTYPQAVADREKQFPTGLPDTVLAAIPHTTGDHVIQSGIAIAQLNRPVTFYNIANPEDALNIQLIFMLAIKHPGEQLSTLQSLTKVFMDTGVMERMRNAGSKEALIAILDEAGWKSANEPAGGAL